MPLDSSGRPSATGAPSVVVDSMQVLFGRHLIVWYPDTTPLGNIQGLAFGSVTVELETPLVFVVPLVEGE